jgi:hypothetical protein
VHLDLQISPQIFGKIRDDPNPIIRGLGEDNLRKKPVAKNLPDIVPSRKRSAKQERKIYIKGGRV